MSDPLVYWEREKGRKEKGITGYAVQAWHNGVAP